MAFKEVKGDGTYLKPKNMTIGQVIEGVLLRKRHDTKFDAMTYFFKTTDGTVGINGCGQLDYHMDNITEGSYVRLTYKGKASYKGGIQPAHQFKVEIDDERAEKQEEKASSDPDAPPDFSDVPPIDDSDIGF
jgi:hypothetical protein